MIGLARPAPAGTLVAGLGDQQEQGAGDVTQTLELDATGSDGDNGGRSSQKGRHLPSLHMAGKLAHAERCPHRVVIVQHFPGSVKDYAHAVQAQGRVFPLPKRCPHPACRATGCLIRWGAYSRWACLLDRDYPISVQRVRCKACGRTHSLLPDFLHPHRHYVLGLLQQVVDLYLLVGLGWDRLMDRLPEPGPGCSTVRAWVGSFAYGAGHLLFDHLLSHLATLDPALELPDQPPRHLLRVRNPLHRRRLERAHTFRLLAESLYAQVKARQPRLHFTAEQLFPFLLHWLHSVWLPPRLFWSPLLHTTRLQPV